MKEYKITYSGESEGYRLITDITEAAAKKFFREQAKELDLEFASSVTAVPYHSGAVAYFADKGITVQ